MSEDSLKNARAKIKELRDQSLALGIMGLLLVIVGVPCYQAIVWLKNGVWPEVDLFFLTAPVSCAETNWEAKGFEGMRICTVRYHNFTEWVGVDKIINWVFDVHVSLLALGIVLLGIFILEEIQNN